MIKLIKKFDQWCIDNPYKSRLLALVVSIIGESLIFLFGVYIGWMFWGC